MMNLIREGGFPVWFVLLFGIVTLATAVAYAINPRERLLGLMRGMGAATLFSTLSGTAANIGATFHAVAGVDPRHPNLNLLQPEGPLMLSLGLGESMSTSILGFAF